MTTTRINHTGHDHPNTPAARAKCRKTPITMGSIAREMFTTPDPLAIDTPAGKIRVGSVVEVSIAGEARSVRGTLTDVSEDIKNGRPGCESMTADRPFWVYADQVIRVISF